MIASEVILDLRLRRTRGARQKGERARQRLVVGGKPLAIEIEQADAGESGHLEDRADRAAGIAALDALQKAARDSGPFRKLGGGLLARDAGLADEPSQIGDSLVCVAGDGSGRRLGHVGSINGSQRSY